MSINISDVSKKFSMDLNHAIKYGLEDIAKGLFTLDHQADVLRKGEFWALKNLTLQVKKGETLGIIGHNGSGKTTLLKLLNGIYLPDAGEIKIRGKTGALIAVGAGFHPLLTGRENIFVNGSIMGMISSEVEKKFDEIVEFAGVGEFLDSPIRNYSSGMAVRLGFSIAVHGSPEILLVDEVLAVGDEEFRRKCFKKMKEIANDGTTIVLVSHNLNLVQTFADRTLLLEDGKKKYLGNTDKAISEYLLMDNQVDVKKAGRVDIQIPGIKIEGFGLDKSVDSFNEKLIFSFFLENADGVEFVEVGLGFRNSLGSRILTATGKLEGLTKKRTKVILKVKDHNLPPGKYSLDMGINSEGIPVTYKESVYDFRISEEGFSNDYLIQKGDKIGVYLPLEVSI